MFSRFAAALTFTGATASAFVAGRTSHGASSCLSAKSVFDFTVNDVNEIPVRLDTYRNKKAILFVNVASK